MKKNEKRKILIILVIMIMVMQIVSVVFAEELNQNAEVEQLAIDEKTSADGTTSEQEEPTDENEDNTDITWTDFSNAQITFKNLSNSAVYAVLSGIKYEQGHSFEICIGENKDTLSRTNNDNMGVLTENSNSELQRLIPNNILSLNKTFYYIIVEKQYNPDLITKVVKGPEELKRPELPKYGLRLDLYMMNKKQSIAHQSLYSAPDLKRNMNYKIGEITDINLLKKFKTNSTEAYIELMDYAKKSNYIANGTLEVAKDNAFNPIDNISLQKGHYYFAYLNLDDESGKYYPIEDVAIYEATDENTLVHFAFESMEFDENDVPPTTQQPTTPPSTQPTPNDPTTSPNPLPYAGKNLILGIIIISFSVISYILYRKNKKLKGI